MMKARTGKYMFLGNVNALFGPGIRYSDTIKGLKLTEFDKDDVRRNQCALFAVRNGKIARIGCNGH